MSQTPPQYKLGKLLRRNWKFAAGLSVVCIFYLIAIFADLIAPYDYRSQSRSEPSAPPITLHFRDEAGNFHFRPFVFERELADPLELRYTEDRSRRFPIEFFVHGYSYSIFGLIPSDTHLFGTGAASASAPRISLLGTDQLGRDRFSRLVHAIRFSLIVSPVGVVLACVIGIALGLISGYSGRAVDTILMGAADAMISLPALILILAARAAFPLELPPMSAAILLIIIFALTGWAEMARLTRGLVRSVREREFVLAATASGLTGGRILLRHVLPNISGPLITQATLMIPVFLLAEIALSFLGVGIQEPNASLGNMLTAAADITQLRSRPFVLLSPAVVIFLFVLGIRLLSDGLQAKRQ